MGGWDAPWHWVVVAVVVIALVGYKKLPDAARSVGRSLRIFKTEIKGMTGDDKAREGAGDGAADAAPRALPRAEIVPPPGAAPAADRPRPRPAPTPGADRNVDAG
ncbi:MAG: Sec-independent protein translocase subunit TatA [Jatrophihabitans sp.]|nr:MAG: Sec-independent protein translocase subunit TatA [Jatrophihabitans sp.]